MPTAASAPKRILAINTFSTSYLRWGGMKNIQHITVAGAVMWFLGSCAFLLTIVLISIRITSRRRGNARLSNASSSTSVRLRRTQCGLIGIGLLCALLSYPFVVWGQSTAPTTQSQESQVKPAWSTRSDYGMPPRLGRQISLTPSTPWHTPDLPGYTSVLKSGEPHPSIRRSATNSSN